MRSAQFGNLVAPADRSIVTASAVSLRVASCRRGRPTTGTAQLRSVSLFGGLVTAAQVTLDVGKHDAASISDLTVNGKPVSSGAATHVALQSWGYLVAGKQASVQVS